VTEEIAALDAVTAVHVDLVPNGISTVVIEAEVELANSTIAAALAEAGDYSLA
jgi:hypothetical protein